MGHHHRVDLGESPSAALPVLWNITERNGWSHSRLALELKEASGKISKLLYGDRKPGRRLAKKLEDLGVATELWDEPIPRGWLPPHALRKAG